VKDIHGHFFWITLSMSLMEFEGEQALFSAFMDISRLKDMEQVLEASVAARTTELQQAKNVLQSTLDNMIDTYYRIDASGCVDWASASVHELLGYSQSEIAGMALHQLSLDGRLFPDIAESLQQHGGEVINEQAQLRHKSGHALWVSISARVMRGEHGEIAGVEGVLRDITKLIEAENEKQEMERKITHVQRLESLGVLAGGIAHDFNNILAGIMGNAELAELNAMSGDPVRSELKNIIAGSSRAADLCSQMLAYSGQGHFLKQEINITQLVEEALQLIDVSIPKNVALHLQLGESLPSMMADKTQVQQVIMNLISNAAESINEEKQGTITVVTSLMQATAADLHCRLIEEVRVPGRYIALTVSDNGCGMTRTTQDKIFDPFFTTKFTGRGLGMSAVLGIVRSHGGVIQVNSRPGKGTRFHILLPVSPQQQRAVAAIADAGATVLMDELTVLVVDDELMVRSVAQRLLQRLGCTVILAEDGAEALELYEQHRSTINLVLLDMTMPVMGGKETWERLHALDAGLPVVVCSGYSSQAIAEKFARDKPSGFLQKPFTFKALHDALQEFG